MKLVVQRVAHASVLVEDRQVGAIGKGLLVFLGITHTDSEADIAPIATKLLNLRIFEDESGKMNLSLQDIEGELLLVSQFTLYGNCSKGNRPSFIEASRPEHARPLYEKLIAKLKELHPEKIQTGEFGAHMSITLLNDGPVTLML